ncbi:hypothetical protein FRB97_000387 [Tulasnella sp. 331]|nr:hypothetical protein FRB97_000387 [Tulasnella sp. 331]
MSDNYRGPVPNGHPQFYSPHAQQFQPPQYYYPQPPITPQLLQQPPQPTHYMQQPQQQQPPQQQPQGQQQSQPVIASTSQASSSNTESPRGIVANRTDDWSESLVKLAKAAELKCDEIRNQMKEMTDGEYAEAKAAVDRLRRELDLDPAPSLEQKLEEKRQSGRHNTAGPAQASPQPEAPPSPRKRHSSDNLETGTIPSPAHGSPPSKRPRGRPKGSRNKPRDGVEERAPESSSGTRLL